MRSSLRLHAFGICNMATNCSLISAECSYVKVIVKLHVLKLAKQTKKPIIQITTQNGTGSCLRAFCNCYTTFRSYFLLH